MDVLVGVVLRVAVVETTRQTIGAKEVFPLEAVDRVPGVEVDRYERARNNFRRYDRQRRIGKIYIRLAWRTEDVVIGTNTDAGAKFKIGDRFFFVSALLFANENRIRGLLLRPQS